MLPIVFGGKHTAENTIVLCKNCHHLVHIKKGYVELAEAGGLSEEELEKLRFLRKMAQGRISKSVATKYALLTGIKIRASRRQRR